MALEVGSCLGHYDVTALIGEGGMGQHGFNQHVCDQRVVHRVRLRGEVPLEEGVLIALRRPEARHLSSFRPALNIDTRASDSRCEGTVFDPTNTGSITRGKSGNTLSERDTRPSTPAWGGGSGARTKLDRDVPLKVLPAVSARL